MCRPLVGWAGWQRGAAVAPIIPSRAAGARKTRHHALRARLSTRIFVLHNVVLRLSTLVLLAALLGGCAGTSRATTDAPVTATPTTAPVDQTTAARTEPLTVAGGPPQLDRDGNPMLGGVGPWEVVQVVSGDSLDVRQDTRVLSWHLAQVDAPEAEECHAAESLRWLEEYVRPVSHPYFVFRPAGQDRGAEGWSSVEVVVADHARVVGDRGSVNVAVVRAGMARWTGLPTSGSESDYRDMAEDLAERLSAAELDARANARGLWGACQGA